MTGGQLRAWMYEHKYTIRRLADTTCHNPSTVQRWRNDRDGHAIPPMLVLVLCALEQQEQPQLAA